MIYSMTGFASTNEQTEQGNISWTIRSLNHRFLDLTIKLPEELALIEQQIREMLGKRLKRGKIDCKLNFQPSAENQLAFDAASLENVIKLLDKAKQHYPTATPPDIINLISWPGVLQSKQEDIKTLSTKTIVLFNQALDQLIVTRQQEGEALMQLLEERLITLHHLIKSLAKNHDEILAAQRTRLTSKVQELIATNNNERLEQEIVLQAQKLDTSEEVERLETHVNEMRKQLKEQTGAAVGRRLDFLIQELHREANTITAKSLDSSTTLTAIEMKVIIEQMREQVQNIE